MPDSDSICRRSPTSQHEAKQQHRAENLASPSIADFNKPWSADVRSTSVTRLRCPQCETMDAIVDDLVAHLLHIYSSLPPKSRYLVGISGPPGSGKTTVASQLVTKLNMAGNSSDGDIAVMVPMDGFHYYRSELDKFPDPAEAHARRGAPHTFNAAKFVELVTSLKQGITGTISAPSFDHSLKDPVEEDIPILPSHRLVILEGNYIHLTVPPWDQAARLLDEKWFILVEKEVARTRVVKRHVLTGVAGSDEEAHKRFGENDWTNGERIWSIQDQVMAHESATVS